MCVIKELVINIVHMIFVVWSMCIIEQKCFKIKLFSFSVIWVSLIAMLVVNIVIPLESEIKAIISLMIFSFLYGELYNKKISDGISMAFIIIFLFFTFEIFFSTFLIITDLYNTIKTQDFETLLILNIIIGGTLILIIRNKKISNSIKKTTEFLNKKLFLHLFLIIVLVMGILTKRNIYFNTKVDYIINLVLVVVFFYLIHLIYKEKSNIKVLSEEQDALYNYMLKYERELNEKNKIIHEFKNQLLTINGFLDTSINKTKKYIKEIMNDIKDKDNNNILNLEKIPKGGLKGLFYYKLSNINEKININLIISKNIKSIENMEVYLYKDVVKILGVYLDNAIEAAIISTDKKMEIEIYEEKGEIHFIISNSFNQEIAHSVIGNYKYSSKGKNRGYGLLLVKDILEKRKNILSNLNIKNNYYTIELVIKI